MARGHQPAGLEASLALANRGYEIVLAEALDTYSVDELIEGIR